MEFKEYFDFDRFLKDKANGNETVQNILKCLLADAYENNNYELGELENHIARMTCVPYEDIVEYRTNLFWKEIKDD